MSKQKTVFFETLGCAKNQVDTEVMVGILSKSHFKIVAEVEQAEIIVVNTCGFIESAKEESLDTIFDLLQHKETGKCEIFIVAGCLAQRYAGDLKNEIPEVDAFIGTTKFDEILTIVSELIGKGDLNAVKNSGELLGGAAEPVELAQIQLNGIYMDDINKDFAENMPRVLSTPDHYAYLKIAEGCDNCCTYCIIPKLRGTYRSRKLEDVVREAEGLAAQGVKELIIIAQDTTRYGYDLTGKTMLPELLRRLDAIEGIRWIRLQYCYPDAITDELIDAIAELDKVVKYIDIPVQHASNTVLKRMNRRTSKEEITRIVETLRQKVSDMVIRTTIIVGFPGETEAEFEELCEFVKVMKFDKLGVFSYSLEEDTAAAKLDGHLEQEIKDERRNRLLEIQLQVSSERMHGFMGRTIEAVVEEEVDGEAVYVARSSYDTPEVDGVVYVNVEEGKTLEIGQFIMVKITDSLEYDLIGGYVDDACQ